jgi:plastocyanin
MQRRAFLGSALSVATLAGCLGDGSTESPGTATPTDEPPSTATASPTEAATSSPTQTASPTPTATAAPTTPDLENAVDVQVKIKSFEPVRVRIDPGMSVRWVNDAPYCHDITSAQFHDTAAEWDYYSGRICGGYRKFYTFEEPGVYEYFSEFRGGRDTMCGAVLVGDVNLDQPLPCEDA